MRTLLPFPPILAVLAEVRVDQTVNKEGAAPDGISS